MQTFDSIPAKLFFKIMKEQKFYEVSEVEFEQIYDEYFLHMDSLEAKNYMKLINQIALLQFKISFLENVNIHLQNKLLSDEDIFTIKKETKIEDLPFLKNDLQIKKLQLEDFKNESESTFYDILASMGQILNRTLDENMSLAMFVATQKLTKKINKK